MMTETETKKWTSLAGPRQTKAANEAINALRWKGRSYIELCGVVGGEERRSQLTAMMSPPSEACNDAMRALAEKFNYTITPDNYKEIISAAQIATEYLEIPVVDKRITAEQEAERLRQNNLRDQQRKDQAAAKSLAMAQLVADLRKQYPWAKPNDGKLSTAARAAANIKEELRRTFPGVTFSCKSDNYSMGNSVDVHWTDGPTSAEVDAILGKYKEGSFDGMEDIYNNDTSASGEAIEIVLGRSKYVHGHRSFSEGLEESIGRGLCTVQKVEFVRLDQRNVFGNMDTEYLSHHVRMMLARTSIPAGGTFEAVEYSQEESEYVARFTAPAKPVVTVTAGTGKAHVERHVHTKKGIDMWIVVLDSRVERDEFDRIRDACKRAGGWYSRAWGKTPGGFAFEAQDAADVFSATL
jgi:hypothetical protein